MTQEFWTLNYSSIIRNEIDKTLQKGVSM